MTVRGGELREIWVEVRWLVRVSGACGGALREIWVEVRWLVRLSGLYGGAGREIRAERLGWSARVARRDAGG